MTRAAFLLFAKVPRPGRVKTRLAASIGSAAAAELAAALLVDSAHACAQLSDIAPILAGDPGPEDPFWAENLSPDWRIEAQGEGDLSQRLARAFAREFLAFDKVCAVGSDHPGLSLAGLSDFLSNDNAVWPARDGGYEAILFSRLPDPSPLFRGIDWSTPRVLEQTLAIARREGIALSIFPETYDLDTEEDLEFLERDLKSRNPSAVDFPRRTWAVLNRIAGKGAR